MYIHLSRDEQVKDIADLKVELRELLESKKILGLIRALLCRSINTNSKCGIELRE